MGKYLRPKINSRLTKDQKLALMQDYVKYYQRQYASNPASLNPKLPKGAFLKFTDKVGALLLSYSKANACAPEVIRFLQGNPLPRSIRALLPREIRVFCLTLNALKQWVSAEQQAMDKLLLGGVARELCRKATDRCLVTGELLDTKTLALHHPVRDGRPPLPLSKAGHSKIEGQIIQTEENPRIQKLVDLKRKNRRSWVQLRRGCLELLKQKVKHTTKHVRANSLAFARQAKSVSGLGYKEISEWLDNKGYGQ